MQAARTDFLSDDHVKAIYAVLPAWGMHRMGDTKTKVVKSEKFWASVRSCRRALEAMKGIQLASTDEGGLEDLLDGPMHEAFGKLHVSVSDAMIVANSKVLHHLLPDLVSPIDRQHTLRFFYYEQDKFVRRTPGGKIVWRTVQIPSGSDCQYAMFADMVRAVRQIVVSPELAETQPLQEPDAPFNTSLPKVADNMVVAFVKAKGKQLGL